MNDTEPKRKRGARNVCRIMLTTESLQKVDAWISHLKLSKDGISISHSDLVNWLVQKYPAKLSEADAKELQSKHFDEVRFLKSLLTRALAAKVTGDKIDIESIVSRSKSKPTSKRKAPKEAEPQIPL